jgi:hypothetical protein
MMGADSYQTESEIASLLAEEKVPVGIGRNTKIRYIEVVEHLILPIVLTLPILSLSPAHVN